MKIINVITNNIFDLPKENAKQLIEASPDVFARVSKNKKVLKKGNGTKTDDTVLKKILDE